MDTLKIVVTDESTPVDLERCLRQVVRSVSRHIEIILITASRHRLEPAVARRVRRRHVASTDRIAEAIEIEVDPERTVVVLRSDARVAPGWLEQVLAGSAKLAGAVGFWGPEALLVVHPAGCPIMGSVRQPLHGIDTVRVGSTNSAASRVRDSATITANLIVRDEQDLIGACLSAVKPFVDEVVVYDTGSIDRTVEIARGLGARVVEGYWDDHFGHARNRALEHCTTEWVLILDADEVLIGDPAALRKALIGADYDAFSVPVVSTSWAGGEGLAETRSVRLARRTRCIWTGALHETLTAIDWKLARSPALAPVRIVHSGYQGARIDAKGKSERNVSISRAAVDALSTDNKHDPIVWCNYGRSLLLADRPDEALAALSVVRDNPTNSMSAVLAARAALRCCFALERFDEVPVWIQLAETHGEAAGQCALWGARLALCRGNLDGADHALRGVVRGRDVWGVEFDPVRAVVAQAQYAKMRGRPAEAVELLLDALRGPGEFVPLGVLLDAADSAGTPYDKIARLVPQGFVARSIRECAHLPAQPAERWCASLWLSLRDPAAVIAGCIVARHLAMQSVLAWALRARETGLVEHCPLRAIAGDEQREPIDRAVATAILAEVLLEQPSIDVLDERLAAVPPAKLDELVTALKEYAPAVLDRLEPDLATVTGSSAPL